MKLDQIKLPLSCVAVAVDTVHNIVLGVRNGPYRPYITWKFDPEFTLDKELSCYWGHYLDNIIEAAEDFEERCGRLPN